MRLAQRSVVIKAQPRVTHFELPGRTRSEKRANLKAARRVAVEYRRIRGRYPDE